MIKGLYTAYTGMVNEQKRLDVLTNNLANADTNGYKKEGTTSQTFADELAIKIKDTSSYGLNKKLGVISMGVHLGETYTNYDQGSIKVTDNETDVALAGNGFFAIAFTNKAGETSVKYTRDGAFTVNTEGYLVTKDGDYVLNQAAWGSVPRSIEMPIFYAQNNIVGTLNMMEAARQNGVKKFVYASSSSVYGDHPGLPKKEGIEGHVLSPYALTKKTDEEFGRLYKTLYGLDTYGMRSFNVFGRRQNPEGMYAAVIPKFLKLLLKDEAPTINGDGRQSRDFTYIDNVIEANLKACLAPSEAAGEAFNIGSGGRVYLIDLYYELCEALGKKIEPVFGPARKGDIRDSNADISKARELLGYDPDYDFEKGIRLAIDWYKENL